MQSVKQAHEGKEEIQTKKGKIRLLTAAKLHGIWIKSIPKSSFIIFMAHPFKDN